MKKSSSSPFSGYLRSLSGITVFIGISLFLVGCFENPFPPEVATRPVENISSTTIMSGGFILSDGGSDIIQKGVCISLNNNPTLNDVYTIDGYGSDDFNSVIDLDPSYTYYIRAYAMNGAGIGYGDLLSLTVPYANVVIVDFSNITGNSAFMRGRIESNQNINARGACWSTEINPTIDDNKSMSGNGDGIFETTLTGLNAGTTYYTRAYAVADFEVFYSDNYIFATESYPEVLTLAINNPGTFIISTGGHIRNGGYVFEAGICWNTSPSPTIDDQRTIDHLIFYPNFYSDPVGLLPGNTYYLRAYAINVAGAGYGNELVIQMPEPTVIDPDGNPYSSVVIGTQTWLRENLRTTKYSNGDEILHLTDPGDWANATTGAWSYYANQASFENPYGKLYNWYAIMDPHNVCPDGWHVPSESEWNTLIDFIGGINLAGNKLKESGPAHWIPNDYSSNSSGFTALPGGGRSRDDWNSWGSYPVNSLGLFWTTTLSDEEKAVGFYLFDSYQSITRQEYFKQTGMSVRCLKD